MSYEPQGRVKPFIDAVRTEPQRVWSCEEIATMCDVPQGNVSAWMSYAMNAKVVHRGRRDGKTVYSGTEFPPEAAYPPVARRNGEPPAPAPAPAAAPAQPPSHPRAPKFGEAWVPPRMITTRPGSEPAPARAPGSPPPPAAPRGVGPDLVIPTFADAAAASVVEEAAPPAPRPEEPASTPAADDGLDRLNDLALKHGAVVKELRDDDGAEEEVEEPVVPDAFVSCRTGEIILVGLEMDEEGRVTIPADLAQMIRRQTAWGPPR